MLLRIFFLGELKLNVGGGTAPLLLDPGLTGKGWPRGPVILTDGTSESDDAGIMKEEGGGIPNAEESFK